MVNKVNSTMRAEEHAEFCELCHVRRVPALNRIIGIMPTREDSEHSDRPQRAREAGVFAGMIYAAQAPA